MNRPLRLRTILVAWLGLALVLALAGGELLRAALRPARASQVTAARRLAPVLEQAFVDSWDRPSALGALVSKLATTLASRIEVRDEAGRPLVAAGAGTCERYEELRLVGRGSVRACDDTARAISVVEQLGPLLVVGLTVWALSAWLAGRLTRPLRELERAAEELGGGASGRAAQGPPGSLEVAVLAAAFDRMAERLRVRVEAQRDRLAIASHELRSPIARLRVLLDLAREGAGTEQALAELDVEIEALGVLVDDLLASARVDFDALRPEPCKIKDVVERARGSHELDLRGAGTVLADPTLLVRALAILIDNAFRHGAPPVRVEVIERRGQIGIAVDDRGSGLPDDPNLALPFSRAAGSRGTGVGLGLALARRIAEAHGGAFEPGASADGGARVTLWFPS